MGAALDQTDNGLNAKRQAERDQPGQHRVNYNQINCLALLKKQATEAFKGCHHFVSKLRAKKGRGNMMTKMRLPFGCKKNGLLAKYPFIIEAVFVAQINAHFR